LGWEITLLVFAVGAYSAAPSIHKVQFSLVLILPHYLPDHNVRPTLSSVRVLHTKMLWRQSTEFLTNDVWATRLCRRPHLSYSATLAPLAYKCLVGGLRVTYAAELRDLIWYSLRILQDWLVSCECECKAPLFTQGTVLSRIGPLQLMKVGLCSSARNRSAPSRDLDVVSSAINDQKHEARRVLERVLHSSNNTTIAHRN
jgi:hypothetical protein